MNESTSIEITLISGLNYPVGRTCGKPTTPSVHQSSALLAFVVREIYRSPKNSPHKGPVTRKMFSVDDVIIYTPNILLIGDYIIDNSLLIHLGCKWKTNQTQVFFISWTGQLMNIVEDWKHYSREVYYVWSTYIKSNNIARFNNIWNTTL